jgi:hypothetical protein
VASSELYRIGNGTLEYAVRPGSQKPLLPLAMREGHGINTSIHEVTVLQTAMVSNAAGS